MVVMIWLMISWPGKKVFLVGLTKLRSLAEYLLTLITAGLSLFDGCCSLYFVEFKP